MIKGEKINLRVVREKDLETFFAYLSDIENRGDFFPIFLVSESEFKKKFQENGFWSEDFGRLVITDKKDRMLGSIWYFKPVTYFDALESGVYHVSVKITEELYLSTSYTYPTSIACQRRGIFSPV